MFTAQKLFSFDNKFSLHEQKPFLSFSENWRLLGSSWGMGFVLESGQSRNQKGNFSSTNFLLFFSSNFLCGLYRYSSKYSMSSGLLSPLFPLECTCICFLLSLV